MEYRRIAELLLQEHPQTVAVALSRMAPLHAAAVLKLLPAYLQADLMQRIVQTDQLPAPVLEEIDRLVARLIR